MKRILYDLFGTYDPNVYLIETTVTNAEGVSTTTTTYQIAEGLAGVDIEYVAGVLLFAIALYSMFRLIAVAFGGGRR